jgi:site-specific recombinase XerD
MANIEFEDIKMTPAAKAENIRGKIFVSVDEVIDFLDFIATRYPKQISEKQRAYYERDFERDIAFISLILGTGMRVSEAISITLDDLDLERQKIRIFRKGFKEDLIEFDDLSKMYLKQYLSIRNQRYKVPPKLKALFVRKSRQHGAEALTKQAVQKTVQKYTKAYGRKNMSVHKLRHTFATLLWENTRNLPLVQEVLGHANSQTTVIYTHISNETREKAVRGLYKQQD